MLLLKIIKYHIQELRKSTQDLYKTGSKVNEKITKLEKKVQNMEEIFNKEIETLKKNQTEMLKMKNTVDQIEDRRKHHLTEVHAEEQFQRWRTK